MYVIKADGKLLYSPELCDDGYKVIAPILHLEVNTAGSLDFTLPPGNAMYSDVHRMKSIITVEQDGEVIFRGRVTEETVDTYCQKLLYCEGDLAFLLDSIQANITIEGTLQEIFRNLILSHNAQVEECKRFTLGNITALDAEQIIKISKSTYDDTFSTIQTYLLDAYGGYIQTRTEGDVHYIDYIDTYSNECSQQIEFGVNLLNYESQLTAQDMCTVLIPLGAIRSGKPLTIESVNDGKIYIENTEAIEKYGRIVKTYSWDGVKDPAELLQLGNEYISGAILPESLTITAVDMHLLDGDIEKIRKGDKVRILSKPHGVDKTITCAVIDADLANVEKTVFTFGLPVQTLTSVYTETVQSFSGGMGQQHIWLTETEEALNINVEAVNLIGHRTTQLEIDVNAAEEAITMKASQQSVDILEEKNTAVELRLDAAEDSISLQAETINLKANKTYVDNLIAKCASIEELDAIQGWADDFSGGSISGSSIIGGYGDFDELVCGQFNGRNFEWKELEIITGGSVECETASSPMFYTPAGQQIASITYVKSATFKPTKTKIRYLRGKDI